MNCAFCFILGTNWKLVTRHFRRRLLTFSISTVGFFVSSFSAVLASDFTGPVVAVLDGDTLEVLHNQHPERIRLSGIDCPEKGQAFGQRAKQAASELVYGKKSRFRCTVMTSTSAPSGM